MGADAGPAAGPVRIGSRYLVLAGYSNFWRISS